MTTHSPLDGLLEVCDQLRTLQDNAARGAIPSEDTLRRTRERVAALGAQTFELLPGIQNQPLAESLNSHEFLVLALLFHRRVSGLSDALAGATLIGLLLRAGVPRSQALAMLGPDAPLRKQNWLAAEISCNGLDPLDGFFLSSTAGLALFWPQQQAIEDHADGDLPPWDESAEGEDSQSVVAQSLRPYASEQDYLWDLYAWRQACLKRAAALFDVELDQPQHPQMQEISEHAHRCWVGIRQRLSLTPESREFGLEKLAADFRLGPNHVLVITHLLFAEILDAELYLSPMECLRLVADRREAAFTMRSLFAPKSRLRREGIVLSDGEDSAKMLAVPLSLADWAVERVLAELGRSPKWSQQDLEDFLRGESGR